MRSPGTVPPPFPVFPIPLGGTRWTGVGTRHETESPNTDRSPTPHNTTPRHPHPHPKTPTRRYPPPRDTTPPMHHPVLPPPRPTRREVRHVSRIHQDTTPDLQHGTMEADAHPGTHPRTRMSMRMRPTCHRRRPRPRTRRRRRTVGLAQPATTHPRVPHTQDGRRAARPCAWRHLRRHAAAAYLTLRARRARGMAPPGAGG